MLALLLAAGQGSRLRPLTDDRPKCLVELDGRSLLNWQLDALRSAGVEDIAVVSGYRGEQIQIQNATRIVNERWQSTNMVESLRCAASLLTRDVLVVYTDIVYSPEIVAAAARSSADIGVVIDRDWRRLWERRMEDPLSDAETLRLDPDGRHIVEIGGSASSLEEIEGQYIGMVRLSAKGCAVVCEALEGARAHSTDPFACGRDIDAAYLTDLLMFLITEGIAVEAIPIEGGWTEIDCAEDLDAATQLLAEGALRLPRLQESRS